MTGILGKNKLFEQNLSKMLNMNFRGSRAEVGRDGSVEKGFEVKGWGHTTARDWNFLPQRTGNDPVLFRTIFLERVGLFDLKQ